MKKSIFCKSLAVFLAICLCIPAVSLGSFAEEPDVVENDTVYVTIDGSKVSENDGVMELISKQAYPAGTTLTFDAYIPDMSDIVANGDFWWGVGLTTDPSVGSVYSRPVDRLQEYTGQNGTNANWGKWVNHTVTIGNGTEDENDYYFYVYVKPGAREIFGFDNFKLSAENGWVIASEDFEMGIDCSIFNCRSQSTAMENYNPHTTYDNYLVLDQKARGSHDGSEAGNLWLVSKNNYPSGSTVTFDAFVPENFTSWWGVGFSETQESDIYNAASHQPTITKKGTWATYTINFPTDGNEYYFYISPSCDNIEGDSCKFLIDNIVVTNNGETLAEESFDFGIGQNIFYLNDGWASVARTTKKTDKAVCVNFDHSYGNISMVSKQKYAGGTTITFDAYVPSDPTWWVVCYSTTMPSNGNWYDWTNGIEYGQQMSSSFKNQWHSYSATLPTTEDEYYIFVVAEHAVNNPARTDTKFLFDNFKIIDTEGNITVYDTLDKGIGSGIFNYYYKNDDLGVVTTLETVHGDKASNNVAAIYPNNISANGSSFISKKAYPGGSKIYFKAYIPDVKTSWWCISSAESIASADIYSNMQTLPTYKGEWREYNVTLPEGADRHFLMGFAIGEWTGDTPVFLDDFYVLDANGMFLDYEDFVGGIDNSIFSIEEKNGDKTAVEQINLNTYVEKNNVLQLANINALSADVTAPTIITKNAYPAGTTVSFDAFIPAKKEGQGAWWGIGFTKDPQNANIYDIWEAGKGQSLPSNHNQWAHYEFEITGDGDYYLFVAGAIGEFEDGKFMLDNVTIGNTVYDNFNGGIDNLFNYDADLVSCVDINSPADELYELGNINGDGAVNIIDLVIMKKYIAGQAALKQSQINACDINKDGDASALDLTEIVNIILGIVKDAKKGITFSAYAAPTISNSNSDTDTMQLAYQKLSEAGFTKAIALYEGASTVTGTDVYDTIAKRSAVAEAQANIALKMADKYNLKYYVKDWSLYGLGVNGGDEFSINSDVVNTEAQFKTIIENMFSAQNPYVKNPAFAGNFGWDEPSVRDNNALSWLTKYYYQQMNALGSKGELLINLLPAYVGEQGTGDYTGAWFWKKEVTKNYSSYIDDYINNIASTTGYICWDYYPLMETYATSKAQRELNYFENFALIANKCKGKNIDLRNIIQSTSDTTGIRAINSKADLGFQIYSGLAFGVKEFTYYQYASPNATTGNSLFNQITQKTTNVYDYAKEINHEVNKLADVYGDYTWDAVMTSKPNNGNFIAGLSTGCVNSHNGVSIANATVDTLVGCFNKNSGSGNAYMLVNALDVAYGQTSTVTLNVGSATSVTYYVNGVENHAAVSNGTFTVDVPAGSGVFVIPQ